MRTSEYQSSRLDSVCLHLISLCLYIACRRRALLEHTNAAEERLSAALEVLRSELSTRFAAESAEQLSKQRQEQESRLRAEVDAERKRAFDEL
jgi:hypothetical protein